VIERLDPRGAADRRIGNHQVHAVHRQVGQQTFQAILAHRQPDRLVTVQGRLQQFVDDRLGHLVGNPHHEALRLPGDPPREGFLHLAPQHEDLVRVPKDQATHVGQHEVSPALHEQLLAERSLQHANLGADRRLRQVELDARLRDAPGPGNGPEVEEVMVVEPGHVVAVWQIVTRTSGWGKSNLATVRATSCNDSSGE
jgi:hypothetical protein